MLRHVVYRQGYSNPIMNGTIAREVALCTDCATILKTGTSFERLVRQHAPRPAAIPSLVGQAIAPVGKRALRPSEISALASSGA